MKYQKSTGRVAATLVSVATAGADFELAIPGHGAVMNRAQFVAYRAAFDAFIVCSDSDRPQDECAGNWADSVQSLLGDDPLAQQRTRGFAAYYVEMLRAHGERSEYCESRTNAYGTSPAPLN